MRTDSEGLIRTDLAYGAFTLEIDHPRFKPLSAVGDTGIAPTTSRRATLEALSYRQLSAKRDKLLKEMEEALNGDPALLVERLAAITAQLELLEPGENEVNYDTNVYERRERLAQIQELAIRAASWPYR